jgi:hypothetical protein
VETPRQNKEANIHVKKKKELIGVWKGKQEKEM